MKLSKLILSAVAAALLSAAAGEPGAKAAAKPEATTLENLQTAYGGESNAKARYEAFAAKAEAEGYLGVASLFRAAALSESVHAARHAKAIETMGAVPKADVKAPDVKSTKENLEAALKGENYERLKMYPAFLKKAMADKVQLAVYSFKGALASEKMHARFYAMALKNLNNWKARHRFIVCQNCGYTTDDLKLKVCPVCSKPRAQFTEVW